MRHLIIDEAALELCRSRHDAADEDIRAFCARHAVQLHILDYSQAQMQHLVRTAAIEEASVGAEKAVAQEISKELLTQQVMQVMQVEQVTAQSTTVHDAVPDTQQWCSSVVSANESCTCKNTYCVRDALLSTIDTDDEINVFLKDLRVACLTNFADRIFVTAEVLRYCTRNNIPHHPVGQWFDCSRLLEASVTKASELQRRQARLLRMEAIKNE